MKKIKLFLLAVSSILIFSQCVSQFPFSYNHEIKIQEKIGAPTKVTVVVNNLNDILKRRFQNIENDLKTEIKNDFESNILVNLNNIKHDYQIVITVELFKYSKSLWGLLLFPLTYLGSPIGYQKSEVLITTGIYNKEGSLLKTYKSKKDIKKLFGIYYGNKYDVYGKKFVGKIVFSEAMDDIKRQIEQDRDLYKTLPSEIKEEPEISNSRIENTKLELANDRLIITYDISGNGMLDIVWVEVTKTDGTKVQASAFVGDIGSNISVGSGKKISWDMKKDGVDLQGEEINITVKGK